MKKILRLEFQFLEIAVIIYDYFGNIFSRVSNCCLGLSRSLYTDIDGLDPALELKPKLAVHMVSVTALIQDESVAAFSTLRHVFEQNVCDVGCSNLTLALASVVH